MSLPGDASTAAALARLYDLDLDDDPGDLDLYLALAARTGGPILELGVGTGRLAVPLAAAGYAVTGVDLDPAMLQRARTRWAETSTKAGTERPATADAGRRADRGTEGTARPGVGRGSLRLVEADVVGLELATIGRFRLALMALGSLLLLDSRHAQREALRTMARHLRPGGLAVVDIWQPDADDLGRYDGRVVLDRLRQDPTTGRLVVRLSSASHEAPSQTVVLTTVYEEGRQGEPATRWVRSDRLRLLSADELAGLAEDAGLEVERLAGGYDLAPIGSGDDRAVLVARRP